MCAHSKLKTPSNNMNLVRSNGRVTDTSSAKTKLAQPRHQLCLAPGIKCRGFSKLLSERESSRMSAEAVVHVCRMMARSALMVSLRQKPSRLIWRKRAASSLSATTECLAATAEMM